MAVDYFHRLLVAGTIDDVRAFRRKMYREYPRTVGGKSWNEVVPFCFEALYELAPAARRVEPEVPCDPYELSAWPLRRIRARLAEVRYQFQTRNLEMDGLLRALSRALPSLTFTLTTLCLDTSSVESCHFSGGRTQRWVMRQRECERHWNRARKKFGLADDEVYEDDRAERWVEEEMLHKAATHWETDRGARRGGRRLQWWNQPRLRDLETERELALYELAESLASKPRRRKRRAKKSPRANRGRKV